jgi:hypothetical protein
MGVVPSRWRIRTSYPSKSSETSDLASVEALMDESAQGSPPTSELQAEVSPDSKPSLKTTP